jgi:hypothetical protein
MLKFVNRKDRRRWIAVIDKTWMDRGCPIGIWVFNEQDDRLFAIFIQTNKIQAGGRERMRFEVSHPAYKPFVFYTD